jgi:hypothetical protein
MAAPRPAWRPPLGTGLIPPGVGNAPKDPEGGGPGDARRALVHHLSLTLQLPFLQRRFTCDPIALPILIGEDLVRDSP